MSQETEIYRTVIRCIQAKKQIYIVQLKDVFKPRDRDISYSYERHLSQETEIYRTFYLNL